MTVRLTSNFERNLEAIEAFLAEADQDAAFDGLLNELAETVIPNLERFPALGALLFDRPARSIEVTSGMERLQR